MEHRQSRPGSEPSTISCMRLALFGGTFDPIHRGHLAIAAAAADAFALDQVIVAPTGRQPLKSDAAVASFADRVVMAALASHADARFSVSILDEPREDGTPNYTVDLMQRLEEANPGADLFAITGADSFLTIRQWCKPEALLNRYRWIVASRPGSFLTEEQIGPLALTAAQRARVHLLTTVHEDVSATKLRQRLATGDPCSDVLPASVAAYITTHRLYRRPGER